MRITVEVLEGHERYALQYDSCRGYHRSYRHRGENGCYPNQQRYVGLSGRVHQNRYQRLAWAKYEQNEQHPERIETFTPAAFFMIVFAVGAMKMDMSVMLVYVFKFAVVMFENAASR